MKRTSKRILSVLSAIIALALFAGVFALPAAAAVDTAGYAAEVVRLVNAERANDGRRALASTNAALNAAAQQRAEEIASRFEHTRPDGRAWNTALVDHMVVFTAAGENIAKELTLPAAAVAAWMNSPDHRSNILGLNVNYTCIGVGVYEMEDGTLCWVQMFINDGSASTHPDAGKISSGGNSSSGNNGGGGSVCFFATLWNWIKTFFSRIFSVFVFKF